ncbi:MAG: cytochrome b [Tropicimonas sp.]|uniref:cytochrome b n=1 Tax=Tropicimonas sp. TaxID=2067044 RepID=UPI003A89EEEE
MTRHGYSGSQILLHWTVAALILFNYIYSDGMGEAFDTVVRGEAGEPLELIPGIHVWVGVAVLVLVVARLILRHFSGAPEAAGSGTMQLVATWGHRALYLLAFLAPLFGAITWFGGIEGTGEAHEVLANLLMLVAGGHAAVALWHHFVLGDGLLLRMFRPRAK